MMITNPLAYILVLFSCIPLLELVCFLLIFDIFESLFTEGFANNDRNRPHEISGEPISVAIGVGAVATLLGSGFLSYFTRCKFFECCDRKWVEANDSGLRHAMRTRLYGQHLAKETLITAAVAHWNNP
ncbi:unnamed protein product [Gongylonema pulchrum]|uniref:Uncharacterized protein n=1 Tax=Gongylonema pulchrum TaxID=637853 RepID=A0A183DH07_9BILA|nr:unnamed protein product [Gongylonema pulchrum]